MRERLIRENALTLIGELDRAVRSSDDDGENPEATRAASLMLSGLDAASMRADRTGDSLTGLRGRAKVVTRDKKHAGPGSWRLLILGDLAALRPLMSEEA